MMDTRIIKTIVSLTLTLVVLSACNQKTNITRIDMPFTVEANSNYLPEDVRPVSSYTIYDKSTWICNYKTDSGDYVCCLEKDFSQMSPWKYCLLIDGFDNAFGFIELGTGDYSLWSEGKKPLFKKVARR